MLAMNVFFNGGNAASRPICKIDDCFMDEGKICNSPLGGSGEVGWDLFGDAGLFNGGYGADGLSFGF